MRYRYDAAGRKRYTTVEVIVSEAAWTPRARTPRATRSPDDMVLVRVAFGEEALRTKLKALGAVWRPGSRLWELPWGVARGLGIEERVVTGQAAAASDTGYPAPDTCRHTQASSIGYLHPQVYSFPGGNLPPKLQVSRARGTRN